VTTDRSIHEEIANLVAREHDLRAQLAGGEIRAEDEHAQLRDLETQLDQCWDLLRQRQALRDAGADPDEAAVRPAAQVEDYLS
jgi:hypothetical protein